MNGTTAERTIKRAVWRIYGELAEPGVTEGLRDSRAEGCVLTLIPDLPIPKPDRVIDVSDEEFVAIAHYRGPGWGARFCHEVSTGGGSISTLRQITETRCWPDMTGRP